VCLSLAHCTWLGPLAVQHLLIPGICYMSYRHLRYMQSVSTVCLAMLSKYMVLERGVVFASLCGKQYSKSNY